MERRDIQIEKFLIDHSSAGRSIADVFIPETTPLEQQSLGQLIVLIEIDTPDPEHEAIIRRIGETIRLAYYGSEQFNIEIAFEQALQKTNENLQGLLREGRSDWVEKLSAILAIQKGRELHFTHFGNIHGFLIHGVRMVDILENVGERSERTNPLKIFSNIISGTLREQDAILFCTTSILDYLSKEKLRRMIVEMSPEKTVQALYQLLAENSHEMTFAAVLTKIVPEPERMREKKDEVIKTPYPSPSAPNLSMNELRGKERVTSELLTPPLLPQFLKRFKILPATIQRHLLHRPQRRRGENSFYSERGSTAFPQKGSIIKMFIAVGNRLLKIVKSPKRTLPRQIRTLPGITNHGAAKVLLHFQALPRSRKLILLAAIILIMIFSTNIVHLGERKERKNIAQGYDERIAEASEKFSSAEAALIYENEEDARKLLSEAKALVESVPEKGFKEKRNSLLEKIQKSLILVNHVVNIDHPASTINLEDLGFDQEPSGMAFSDSSLFVYSSRNQEILIISTQDHSAKTISLPDTIEGDIQKILPLRSSHLLLTTANEKFYDVNAQDGTSVPLTLNIPIDQRTIQDVAIYLGRIYILDPQSSQIFRHDRSGNVYGAGTPWVTDPTLDLKNAVSLTIDGALYVAKSNGEIWKLLDGGKDPGLTLSSLDPSFSRPTKIVTAPNIANLYILDSLNQRIVVLTKEGKLMNQYSSQQFDNLKDFIVLEDQKTIYVLNGKKILKLDLGK